MSKITIRSVADITEAEQIIMQKIAEGVSARVWSYFYDPATFDQAIYKDGNIYFTGPDITSKDAMELSRMLCAQARCAGDNPTVHIKQFKTEPGDISLADLLKVVDKEGFINVDTPDGGKLMISKMDKEDF